MRRRVLYVGGADSGGLGGPEGPEVWADLAAVYEVVVARGVEEAERRLGEGRFDVVVADVPVGGDRAVVFLNEVKRRDAGTIRLALVGAEDREGAMGCAREMHSCLPRPCPPRLLLAGIRRALSVDTWLRDERLTSLVARMPPLPSLPSIYRDLVTVLGDGGGSAEEIEEVLATDLGVTARLLQTVNSAFYGRSRRITQVGEAVVVLGTEAVRSIVLCLQASAQLGQDPALPFPLERLWEHSLAVGERARRIALLQTHEREVADEAFTAGMMHDIGMLVLAANLPAEYAAMWKSLEGSVRLLVEAEREVFGASHADVGAYLLARWGMPITVVEAVAHHHEPSRGWQEGFSVLTAVHAADGLVGEEGSGMEPSGRPALDEGYLGVLGLQGRLEPWRRCGRMQPARPADRRRRGRSRASEGGGAGKLAGAVTGAARQGAWEGGEVARLGGGRWVGVAAVMVLVVVGIWLGWR